MLYLWLQPTKKMTPETPDFLTHEVFEKLFLKCERNCIAHAMTIVRDQEVAHDMVNESFAILWAQRGNIENTNLDGYVFRTLHNLCLQYRRSLQRKQAAYEKIQNKELRVMQYYTEVLESCNPGELFESEMQAIYTRQMEQLPELTRTIFNENRINGKTYQQIAEQYGITMRKVEREIRHVLEKLRTSPLKDYLTMLMAVICWL